MRSPSSLFFVRLELSADNGRTSCVCHVSMSSLGL